MKSKGSVYLVGAGPGDARAGQGGQQLPGDWLGEEAATAFRGLYEALDAPAWRYYDSITHALPALGDAGASVSARWFHIAPMVNPVWSTHGALATMPSKSSG